MQLDCNKMRQMHIELNKCCLNEVGRVGQKMMCQHPHNQFDEIYEMQFVLPIASAAEGKWAGREFKCNQYTSSLQQLRISIVNFRMVLQYPTMEWNVRKYCSIWRQFRKKIGTTRGRATYRVDSQFIHKWHTGWFGIIYVFKLQIFDYDL